MRREAKVVDGHGTHKFITCPYGHTYPPRTIPKVVNCRKVNLRCELTNLTYAFDIGIIPDFWSRLQVGVADAKDPTNQSCSGGFTLTALDDIVVDPDADFVQGLTVISPETGDLAYVGQEYTVQVNDFRSAKPRCRFSS